MSKSPGEDLRDHFQAIWLNASLLNIATDESAEITLRRIGSLLWAVDQCEDALNKLLAGEEAE